MQQYSLNYFTPEEFVKCNPKCDISQMDLSFLRILDVVRADCGFAFKLNSAFRSSEYDKSKGRTGLGYHTLGRAVDVACTESWKRARIIESCVKRGLSCGVAKRFIHIDNRELIDPIVFLY